MRAGLYIWQLYIALGRMCKMGCLLMRGWDSEMSRDIWSCAGTQLHNHLVPVAWVQQSLFTVEWLSSCGDFLTKLTSKKLFILVRNFVCSSRPKMKALPWRLAKSAKLDPKDCLLCPLMLCICVRIYGYSSQVSGVIWQQPQQSCRHGDIKQKKQWLFKGVVANVDGFITRLSDCSRNGRRSMIEPSFQCLFNWARCDSATCRKLSIFQGHQWHVWGCRSNCVLKPLSDASTGDIGLSLFRTIIFLHSSTLFGGSLSDSRWQSLPWLCQSL